MGFFKFNPSSHILTVPLPCGTPTISRVRGSWSSPLFLWLRHGNLPLFRTMYVGPCFVPHNKIISCKTRGAYARWVLLSQGSLDAIVSVSCTIPSRHHIKTTRQRVQTDAGWIRSISKLPMIYIVPKESQRVPMNSITRHHDHARQYNYALLPHPDK
jgi:hypothetical protein